jgi:DNA-binding transcriptional LysR family regulator
VNTEPHRDADLDIRLLRNFVAVAEELHFTRAASRLFVAQQALSRDISRLEERLGTRVLTRTTRRVTLTPEGTRLLERARELIRLHDEIVAEVGRQVRPTLVDLMSEGPLTGPRILDVARRLAPSLQFRGRYGGGMGSAMRRLAAAELDIALGRADWRGRPPYPGTDREVVRFEPLALLVPHQHPLAQVERITPDLLAGHEIDVNTADPDAPEWSDLAVQFLALSGAFATAAHLPAVGREDQAHHLVQQGLPILTTLDHADVPGGDLRPLVDPVPIYCWSLVWRRGTNPAALTAMREAAAFISEDLRWTELPEAAWLPEPEASSLGAERSMR